MFKIWSIVISILAAVTVSVVPVATDQPQPIIRGPGGDIIRGPGGDCEAVIRGPGGEVSEKKLIAENMINGGAIRYIMVGRGICVPLSELPRDYVGV